LLDLNGFAELIGSRIGFCSNTAGADILTGVRILPDVGGFIGIFSGYVLLDAHKILSGRNSSLEAKHVQKKATKKHADRRPKKSRMSDKIRKPVVYPEVPSVPEYTISDAPASPAAKPE